MPGYNHPADCSCGWCYKISSGITGLGAPRGFLNWYVRWTYESFTVPNARCPFCRESVFFYQSPYGGKVYFDHIGPPWPKHHCTDNASTRGGTTVAARHGAANQYMPKWKKSGWIPFVVDRIQPEDGWYVFKCRRHLDQAYFRLLSVTNIEGLLRAPAFLSCMSDDGVATISYLSSDTTVQQSVVYDYGTHCLSDPPRS